MHCPHCQTTFEIRPEDRDFYEQIDVPEPRTCPQCRMIRRFMERNPKTLYYRKCDLTGEQTLSQYSEKKPFPVYSPEAWWGDDWEALDYGREYDFSRPFFEQYKELKNQTPHLALFNTVGTIQNSDYNNCTAYLKNCYLIAESDYCEGCYYSNLLKKCTNVVDCSVCYECELCYQCIDCTKCYNLKNSQDCENCSDSYFLKNCHACRDCIGCINQRQKQYMIRNQQYTKAEYEQLKAQFDMRELEKLCEDFFLTQPHKNLIAEQNENSSGDHLFNSKNAHRCFDSVDLEDCAYCAKLSLGVKNCLDYNSWGNKAELIYQSAGCGDNVYNLKFCVNCQSNMRDCEYCAECFSSADCFGCVGLKRKRFCILNKQYSEAEYQDLKAKIIEQMKENDEYGEFFPLELCPFDYEETMAADAFPRGEISDCRHKYKVIEPERAFYQKMGLPEPDKCPSCRHKERMRKRNPLKLWSRPCGKCGAEMQTNYPPESKERVYCEKCYLKQLY